jgi:hypothetical protein
MARWRWRSDGNGRESYVDDLGRVAARRNGPDGVPLNEYGRRVDVGHLGSNIDEDDEDD